MKSKKEDSFFPYLLELRVNECISDMQKYKRLESKYICLVCDAVSNERPIKNKWNCEFCKKNSIVVIKEFMKTIRNTMLSKYFKEFFANKTYTREEKERMLKAAQAMLDKEMR